MRKNTKYSKRIINKQQKQITNNKKRQMTKQQNKMNKLRIKINTTNIKKTNN